MSTDYIDFRNRNKYYCPDCQELLHPETEEYSIAKSIDAGVRCEECLIKIKDEDFDSWVESEFKAVPV